ncbi:hypothetical protein [Mycobacterium sp. UM_Kg1]|uniref:hypothetical protein n=1 Tax=Mycobacterium sp. UM_Kg1 TaxID=1545691 RepID=UPI00061AFB64|nr:hypothetical protein [Mycobacterium sp. UM_Kg1]
MLAAQAMMLTDDEVVALAAMLGRAWPTGLATVAATSDELTKAAVRGLRSLAARGIIAEDPEGGYRAHPGVVAVIQTFLRAPRRIGAYLAPVEAVQTMAGASITAVPVAGIWWIDSATADGVHGFRQAEGDDVLGTITELAEQTRDGTLLSGIDDPSSYACVIVYGDGTDEQTVVLANSTDRQSWDRGPLARALAAAGA